MLAWVIEHWAAITGIVTAFVGIYRFSEEGRRQREVAADGLYQTYLAKAFDNPKLAWPEGKVPSDEKYTWLVAMMCNALTAQLAAKPKPDMIRAIKHDLLVHEAYFDSPSFEKEDGGWKLYPDRLHKLYEKAKAERQART